jgi:tetratricopeptide (TPR) repeat protein
VEQALEAFSHTLTLDPDLAPAYRERGVLHLAQGNAEAALADAQAAVAADPEYAEGYILLGEVLRRAFDDPAQALRAYERGVRLDPDLAEPTFPARWRAARAAGLPNRMIALANEYLNTHEEDPLVAYYLGQALIARGTPTRAIEVVRERLEEEEDSAAAWFTLGQAYAATNAWSYARVSFEQARTLTEAGDNSLTLISDTPVTDLFGALGEAYVYTGRCIDAQFMLNHALALGPDRPEYHTLLGQALICQTPTPTPTPYPWESP